MVKPIKAFQASEKDVFIDFNSQYSVLLLLVFLDKYFTIFSPVRHNQGRHNLQIWVENVIHDPMHRNDK